MQTQIKRNIQYTSNLTRKRINRPVHSLRKTIGSYLKIQKVHITKTFSFIKNRGKDY